MTLNNRKRNIRFNLYLSEQEKEMIFKIAQSTGLTYTDLLVNWINKEYENLEIEEKEEEVSNYE